MSRNGKGPQGGKGNLQRFFGEVKISNVSCMIHKLIDKTSKLFSPRCGNVVLIGKDIRQIGQDRLVPRYSHPAFTDDDGKPLPC